VFPFSATGAVAAAGAGAAVGPGPDLFAFLAAAVLGVPLAAVDLASLRLPDPLVGALLAAVAVALPAAAILTGDPGRLGRAALGGALCFTLHLAAALLPGGPLGPGDVKLAGVLGLLLGWLGWPAVGLGLALPHLLNGPVAVVLLVTRRAGRRTALPFGPALLAGALLATVLAA
jgi:leader peptidase (prepilin peptidase) / N-methyltransferase